MKILVYSGMAFHYRSLLPVINELINQGNAVSVFSRGVFSIPKIRENPRAFGDVNFNSLEFVASQIGVETNCLSKINFLDYTSYFQNESIYKEQDLFLTVTKEFQWLNRLAKYNKPRVAVPYQNMLNTYFDISGGSFPERCPNYVYYEKEIEAKPGCKYSKTGLSYLKEYFKYNPVTDLRDVSNRVLLLHPGGYRNILTKHKTGKRKSRNRQLNLYRMLTSSTKKELSVKIHPLAAKYHDLEFNQLICEKHKIPVKFTSSALYKILNEYDSILSLGSSSFFEILPLKIPYWNINLISSARTMFYKDIEGTMINSLADFKEKIDNNKPNLFTQQHEIEYINKLLTYNDEYALERQMKIINNLLL